MPGKSNFDFKKILLHARDLRKNSTEAEKILWKELRGRKLSGFKFLRQHPLIYKGNLKRFNYFVADFYCDSKKAVIELDGPVHENRTDYDNFRDKELEELGLNVLRLNNEELQDITSTLNKINNFLKQIPENKFP